MKLVCWLFFISGGLFMGCRNDRHERLRLESINRSLEKANEVISDQTSLIIHDLMNESHGNRYYNTRIWVPLADSVRIISFGINEFVDSLIAEMKLYPEREFKDRDRDAVQQIIEKEGKGKLLYDRLIAYRLIVFNLFSPERLETYPDARAYRASELAEIKKLAPVNLTLFADTAILTPMNITDWSAEYFSRASSVEAIMVLNKIKNDVLSTGIMLIHYCEVHITKGEPFEQYSAIIAQSTKYAKKVDSLEITAGIGTFSLISKPTFTINGAVVPPGDEGAAIYKMRVAGAKGMHIVPVKVEFYKPDGSTTTMIREIKYTIID